MPFAKTRLRFLFVVCISLTLAACGSSDSVKVQNGGGGSAGKANRLNWEAVSRDNNPSIETIDFETFDAAKLKVDLFSFDNDVELIYSNDLQPNTARINLYKVRRKQAKWGTFNSTLQEDTLKLNMTGSYQCLINIKNGMITELERGCYVRLQLVLPQDSQLEVYNVGKLISRRFIAMSNAELLETVDAAGTTAAKFTAVDTWLRSYSAIGKRPKLTAEELGTVVYDFTWRDAKLAALGKLQTFTTDRENLGAMIDRRFSLGEREDARRICGL